MVYKNTEERKKYDKDYYYKVRKLKYIKHPRIKKTKEQIRETKRLWNKANPDKVREMAKKSREKHKEQRKIDNKKWVENNKSYLKEYRKKNYTGIYGSWYAMKQRCDNPKSIQYKDYGGRGIKYCEKWKSFSGFKEDMVASYKRGLTIEREDNNGNYCKENCRWSTYKEQANNKRNTVFINFNGIKKTINGWAVELGINKNIIKSRYYRGMTIENVLQKKLFRPRKLT